MKRSAERGIWHGMLSRCRATSGPGFKYYASRGITVCERWRESFASFATDMGPRPTPDHSIDRINSDGNYEPGNCRWATAKEQANNRRVSRAHRAQTMKVLAFVRSFCADSGIPPTMDEVGAALGFSSRGVTKNALRRLAEQGLVETAPRIARGVRPVHMSSRAEVVPPSRCSCGTVRFGAGTCPACEAPVDGPALLPARAPGAARSFLQKERLLSPARAAQTRSTVRATAEPLSVVLGDYVRATVADLDTTTAAAVSLGIDRKTVRKFACSGTGTDLRGAQMGLLLGDVKRRHVLYVFALTGCNKVAAARLLGVDRVTIYRLLDQYGVVAAEAS